MHRDSAQEASVDDILCYRPNKNVLLKKKVRTSDLFLTRETFCRFIAELCHFVVFFCDIFSIRSSLLGMSSYYKDS